MPADLDFTSGAKGTHNAVMAMLFMGAGTNAYDAFSAVNSSPWTSETFGGDPEKEKSLREYVMHAMIISAIYAVGGAYIARSWIPILGFALATVYMYWLYDRAIARSKSRGNATAALGQAQSQWNSGGGY